MPTIERAGGQSGIATIKAFSGNGFKIGDRICIEGVLIWPENAVDWAVQPVDSLNPSHFDQLEGLEPAVDLLLIGTGQKLVRPSRQFFEAMFARGIGVEPMDSRAAARTYNLLASEGRRVAAALYPLDA